MFRANVRVVRIAMAAMFGCDESAFETETLTIVKRPDPPLWPFIAAAATFGLGTVVSVEQAYREFVDANPPERHYWAVGSTLLEPLAVEAGRRGFDATVSRPGIGWVLASVPVVPPLPPRLQRRVVDAAWMAAEQQNRRFENGVGLPGVAARDFRNRYGVALFDAAGEPVAVAGAFFTYADGISEIGVDVLRDYRGQGLGELVVAAAVREILDRGDVPVYGCAATNIRSQRTALAAGFLPAYSDAAVA